MKKSRFTESQIVVILKESEGGITITEVLRSHGISATAFYKWRSNYVGLEASELKRVNGKSSLRLAGVGSRIFSIRGGSTNEDVQIHRQSDC
jgi:hypothetical protein